jgi:hypothetical protein
MPEEALFFEGPGLAAHFFGRLCSDRAGEMNIERHQRRRTEESLAVVKGKS